MIPILLLSLTPTAEPFAVENRCPTFAVENKTAKSACPCKSTGCACDFGKCNCGPYCSCPNCPDSYAGAYAKALAGQRVTFTVRATDPTRPANFAIGKYEFWKDETGLHHRRIEPVVPKAASVPRLAPVYPAYPFGACPGGVCLPGGR